MTYYNTDLEIEQLILIGKSTEDSILQQHNLVLHLKQIG